MADGLCRDVAGAYLTSAVTRAERDRRIGVVTSVLVEMGGFRRVPDLPSDREVEFSRCMAEADPREWTIAVMRQAVGGALGPALVWPVPPDSPISSAGWAGLMEMVSVFTDAEVQRFTVYVAPPGFLVSL